MHRLQLCSSVSASGNLCADCQLWWLKPLQEYIRLFYGLGVMLLMVFMPMGLAGLYRKIAGQVRERLHLGYKTRIGAGGQAEV